jgi:adenine-specific DNA-methyltransferase
LSLDGRGDSYSLAVSSNRDDQSPGVISEHPLMKPAPLPLDSLDALIGAAVALGARSVEGWSPAESQLIRRSPKIAVPVTELRELIKRGHDPLGDAYCRIRSSGDRRGLGQTYTPASIIASMMDWAANEVAPARVIDPGSGSGRFTVAAGRRFPGAQLLAADVDPIATLMTRGSVAAAGLADRTTVVLGDYRELQLPRIGGPTLFVGNPPYVRHHQIDPEWKRWLIDTAADRGHAASGLAGLHVYFFLATVLHSSPGDVGAFITSAEWLDVNYGSLVRELLLDGLGGLSMHVLDPDAAPFADAATTGVITTFRTGSQPSSLRLRRVKRVDDLGALEGGRLVSRARLTEAKRWTPLTRVTPKLPEGWIELGELCRVHRGSVTGANAVWVTRVEETDLPSEVLFPSVTRARELFAAGHSLGDVRGLRSVIDLPADLDVFDDDTRKAIDRFLRRAKKGGVAEGYIARSRRAWWSVGLRKPAPILATYMARRPPAFVRNLADARHINIAHGLYPREPMGDDLLDRLATALRSSAVVGQGRTYAGGLTKFEPREMERIPVPNPELLSAAS